MNIVINISAEGTPAEVAKSLQAAVEHIAGLKNTTVRKNSFYHTSAALQCNIYKVIG